MSARQTYDGQNTRVVVDDSVLYTIYTDRIARAAAREEMQDVVYSVAQLGRRVQEMERTQYVQSRREAEERQTAGLDIQFDKVEQGLNRLAQAEDLSEQLQRTTPLLKCMDHIFALYRSEEDRYRRQLLLKLRSALKLNCTHQMFTPQQLEVVSGLVRCLRGQSVTKREVLAALDRLEDVELSPFPVLED